MGERSTKDAWLQGPGDLREAEVEDVPVKGQSVKVRGLPAAYSNDAVSEALESRQVGRDTISTVNKHKLEILQFVHGVLEPRFDEAEAEEVAKKYGPAWAKVIAEIDRLSGLDKEAVDEAAARFPSRGESKGRPDVGPANGTGDGKPTVPARTGA